jgi:hypothetical protein
LLKCFWATSRSSMHGTTAFGSSSVTTVSPISSTAMPSILSPSDVIVHSELLGAAREFLSELLGSFRSCSGILGAARGFSELLGDSRSCSEISRLLSELLGDFRVTLGAARRLPGYSRSSSEISGLLSELLGEIRVTLGAARRFPGYSRSCSGKGHSRGHSRPKTIKNGLGQKKRNLT